MSDPTTHPAPPGNPILQGVACMVLGCLLLTVNDALVKWVTQDYPVGQAMFIRGIFVLIPMALLARREGGLVALRVQRWDLQLARGVLSIVSTFLFIFALGLMPLADAVAITFASPLIITALAPVLLNEPVGWRRRLAVAVGFLGVMVMLRPADAAFRTAALLPLGVAVCEAIRDMVTRRMVLTESTVATTIVSSSMVALAGLVVAIPQWRELSWNAWIVLAACGCLMGGAHFLMMEAFRFGEAALVSPFRYSSVIWALLIGVAMFADWPDSWMLLGSAIVIGSGLYILRREVVQSGRSHERRDGDPAGSD